MAIDWKLIPREFHYLRCDVTEKYGDELRVKRFDESLNRHVGVDESLSASQLKELAAVYFQVVNRSHNRPILEWCLRARSQADVSSSWVEVILAPLRPFFPLKNRQAEIKGTRWRLLGLLLLMRQLGERGVEPFSEKLMEVEFPSVSPSWKDLPEHLACLEPIFDRYSDHFNEDRILKWLRHASRSMKRQLEEDAQLMFRLDPEISVWYAENVQTDAARAVYWMHIFFDAAGIREDSYPNRQS